MAELTRNRVTDLNAISVAVDKAPKAEGKKAAGVLFAVRLFDANNDGVVNAEELRGLDKSGDGKLSRDELTTALISDGMSAGAKKRAEAVIDRMLGGKKEIDMNSPAFQTLVKNMQEASPTGNYTEVLNKFAPVIDKLKNDPAAAPAPAAAPRDRTNDINMLSQALANTTAELRAQPEGKRNPSLAQRAKNIGSFLISSVMDVNGDGKVDGKDSVDKNGDKILTRAELTSAYIRDGMSETARQGAQKMIDTMLGGKEQIDLNKPEEAKALGDKLRAAGMRPNYGAELDAAMSGGSIPGASRGTDRNR